MAGLNLMYDDRRLSFFHRADPASKFAFVLAAVVLALVFQRAAWNVSLLVVVAALVVPLTSTSLWTYLGSMKLLLTIATLFGLGIPFLGNVPGTVLFHTPFKAVTDAGLDSGANVFSRLVIIGITSVAFVRTTHPSDIVQAVARLGLEYKYAHSLALTVIFLPLLLSELEDIRRAQKVRRLGADEGRIRRLVTIGLHLMFASLVRALRRAQALAVSMTAKGFGRDRERTYLRQYVPFPPGQLLARASVLVFLGASAAHLYALWR